MANKHEIISALDGLADAFNAHNIDKIMSYFEDNCGLDMPRGLEPHGSRYRDAKIVRKDSYWKIVA
jgi:ketosteroid isomerase-like protein